MRRVRLALLWALGIATLGVSAMPAFTATPADNGAVVGTVTALGGGACLQLSSTAVSFGTLPFSTRTQVSSGPGSPTPSFQNCGNFNETISIAGSNATGTNTSWQLTGVPGTTCLDASGAARTNAYGLSYDAPPTAREVTSTPTAISTYAPGAAVPLGLQLRMPCVGSSGDGQVISFSVNLTAAVA